MSDVTDLFSDLGYNKDYLSTVNIDQLAGHQPDGHKYALQFGSPWSFGTFDIKSLFSFLDEDVLASLESSMYLKRSDLIVSFDAVNVGFPRHSRPSA